MSSDFLKYQHILKKRKKRTGLAEQIRADRRRASPDLPGHTREGDLTGADGRDPVVSGREGQNGMERRRPFDQVVINGLRSSPTSDPGRAGAKP
jgi:hypothetical protein